MSIFSLKRFAFQTIRPSFHGKTRFSALFGRRPCAAASRFAFFKGKMPELCETASQNKKARPVIPGDTLRERGAALSRTPFLPAACAGCQLPYVSTTCLRFRGQDAYALSQPLRAPPAGRRSVALCPRDCKPGKESTPRKDAMRFSDTLRLLFQYVTLGHAFCKKIPCRSPGKESAS